jgi:hypothetical protein
MPELTRRYIVMTMATEAPFDLEDPEAPFVLKPWKDPAALRALEAYRDHCYPELAADITDWIESIQEGERIRGGVGTRNEPFAAARPKARGAAPAARKPAKAVRKKAAKKPAKKKGKRRG